MNLRRGRCAQRQRKSLCVAGAKRFGRCENGRARALPAWRRTCSAIMPIFHSPPAEELKVSVTFRLDRAQLDFVNDTFTKILNDAEGQVKLVELSPRPEILPGQVIRFELGNDVDLKLTETQRAQTEARRLAEWIREADLQKLRARSWRAVAILLPPKDWFRPFPHSLLAAQHPIRA